MNKPNYLQGLNLLTMFWMWYEKKPRLAIAFKDSNLHIHLEEVLDLEWEHYSFPRLEKNIPTEL